MAEDEETKIIRRPKQETLSWAAIVFSVLAGGGGFGLNVQSNKDVSTQLRTLNDVVIELRADVKQMKESSERKDRRDDKQDDKLDKSASEVQELRQRVSVLEAKK